MSPRRIHAMWCRCADCTPRPLTEADRQALQMIVGLGTGGILAAAIELARHAFPFLNHLLGVA